jgi:hypothetical protein
MSRALLLSTLAFLGCQTPDADPLSALSSGGADDWQLLPSGAAAAPSTGGITLTAPAQVLAGQSNTFEVAGTFPGESVYFVRSSGGVGAGRCFPFLGGGCLGVTSPFQVVGAENSDSEGLATFELFVPAAAEGRSYALQALVIHALDGLDTVFSDPVEITVTLPDRDGDGVLDADDPCPDVAGAALGADASCPAAGCGDLLAAGESTSRTTWLDVAGTATEGWCDLELVPGGAAFVLGGTGQLDHNGVWGNCPAGTTPYTYLSEAHVDAAMAFVAQDASSTYYLLNSFAGPMTTCPTLSDVTGVHDPIGTWSPDVVDLEARGLSITTNCSLSAIRDPIPLHVTDGPRSTTSGTVLLNSAESNEAYPVLCTL